MDNNALFLKGLQEKYLSFGKFTKID